MQGEKDSGKVYVENEVVVIEVRVNCVGIKLGCLISSKILAMKIMPSI